VTQRILLYSPDVIGHPRVYCRVIADALTRHDCEVVLAMGFTDTIGFAESADLHPLAAHDRVRMIDNRTRSATGRPHLTAEELVSLQRDFAIDTTLFIEADKSNDELRRIAAGDAPRLHGRNLGIFANTAEWYPGEDSFTGARKRIIAPTLRTTLGNVKRAIFQRRRTARWFYERVILGSEVLDEILTKDERLAEWYGPPVYWMPEISRPVDADETDADREEYAQTERDLERFLAANAGREPVLYFGDAAFYKGYDLFLDFVARTPSACGIHPGRTYDAQNAAWFQHDVEALRARLRNEGWLFETNRYVHAQRLKELFFGSIRLYITTHRLALSSSTVIQAMELGKPVLVPDRGLLGYRVRTHGIGDVYRYGDVDDLKRKAEQLWRTDLTRFEEPAHRLWSRFSDEAIREFFVERLLR
jgi:glycosyltransferase involved in cell wall biosynthesis